VNHTKTLMLASVLVLLCSGLASAQTHPCDISITPNPTVSGLTVKVGFCWDAKDIDGQPAVATAFLVQIDGATKFNGPLTPIGLPSATGFSYYEVGLSVSKGSHTTAAAIVTADGTSPFTTPFAFAVVGSAPKPPTAVRVTK
jgi:hypothetical protein